MHALWCHCWWWWYSNYYCTHRQVMAAVMYECLHEWRHSALLSCHVAWHTYDKVQAFHVDWSVQYDIRHVTSRLPVLLFDLLFDISGDICFYVLTCWFAGGLLVKKNYEKSNQSRVIIDHVTARFQKLSCVSWRCIQQWTKRMLTIAYSKKQ